MEVAVVGSAREEGFLYDGVRGKEQRDSGVWQNKDHSYVTLSLDFSEL